MTEVTPEYLARKFDAELFAQGLQITAFHLEAGQLGFVELVERLIADLGVSESHLKPYLRGWYNGARDALEDHGIDMRKADSAESVRAQYRKIFGGSTAR